MLVIPDGRKQRGWAGFVEKLQLLTTMQSFVFCSKKRVGITRSRAPLGSKGVDVNEDSSGRRVSSSREGSLSALLRSATTPSSKHGACEAVIRAKGPLRMGTNAMGSKSGNFMSHNKIGGGGDWS